MSHEPVYLFIGAYASEADAQADYAIVRELHERRLVGTYDAAVVVREGDGGVTVRKDELPTRRGAFTGAGAGAVVGLLFPPALLASAAVGAAAGAVAGHLWRGLSRNDVRQLGEVLDEGQAALVVVGKSEVARHLHDRGGGGAVRETEVRTSADPVALQRELDRSLSEMTPAAPAVSVTVTEASPRRS
jgi:uncharacterized membrane protein